MAKIVYVVLDGAPDSPNSPRKTLEEAFKPNLDSLARSSLCGLVYTVKPGVAPQSDYATLSLLGYNPDLYYPGRGPLEALGAGLDMSQGDIALRANFATVDPDTMRIIDRRAGRSLSSREARVLAEALDGMELDEGRGEARFRSTIGHRGVLLLRHREHHLSDMITNTDPAYRREGRYSVALENFEPYVAESRPLEDSEPARVAAMLLNEFTRRAVEMLDGHPVNLERARRGLLKANAVLSRDAGKLPDSAPPSFRSRFGLSGASIAEMVVEVGISRYVGLNSIGVEVEGRPKAELYREEAEKALKALEDFDLVYVHLKGPDEPGHDGDIEGKVRAVEEIDMYFFSSLVEGLDGFDERPAVIVTSDHATPWDRRSHSGDPVPLMVHHPAFSSGPSSFSETACEGGRLGLLVGGYKILPSVLRLLPA